MRLTVEASILEPRFVDIGAGANLRHRLGEKIRIHLNNLKSPHSGSQLNHATKTAVEMKWDLEVSWAETESNESAVTHEAALIRAYYEWNGRTPSFKSLTGKWITGNQVIPKREGTVSTLDWTDWMPMGQQTRDTLPARPGVYRIRAVPPGA